MTRLSLTCIFKVRDEGIDVFPGHRNVVNIPDGTQVSPDLVALLQADPTVRADPVLINVEVEFTAMYQRRREAKLDVYRRLNGEQYGRHRVDLGVWRTSGCGKNMPTQSKAFWR